MSENKWVAKVQSLLAKAESTASEAEASALMAKAQELMLKFAVDQALLAKEDPSRKTKPIVRTIDFGKNKTGIKALRGLFSSIAKLNRCQVWMHSGRQFMSIAGFEEDVEFCEMLYHSIELQMVNSGSKEFSMIRRHDTNKRNFMVNYMYSYVIRVLERMRQAKVESESQVLSSSTALAVRDRSAEVAAFVQQNVGRLHKGPRARHSANSAASSAGYRDGGSADISGGRNNLSGNTRKGLGR